MLAAVKSTSTDQELSDASGLSVGQLEEHFTHHIAKSATGDEGLDAALTDCSELYICAVASGHWQAAASALTCRARLLNDLRRREDSTAKRKNLLGAADPKKPEFWGPELSLFVRLHLDWIIERVTAMDEVSA